MSLQVRLRHALGERVLELPEREVSTPLVVGRGREANLQVPSISVAPQHCVLFVHEGQWVVQPMAGVVTLNGGTITEPTALQIGDILGLGKNAAAPVIQIDPIGAAEGRKGPAAAVVVAAPVSRSSLRPTTPNWGAPMPAPAPAPAPRHQAYAPPAVPPQRAAVDQGYAEPGPEDGVDWAAATAASDSTSAPRKYVRRKQSSTGPMVVAIVLGVVGFIALIVYAYKATHRPPQQQVIVEQVPPPPAKAAKRPTVMFDLNADQADARAAHMQKAPGSAPPPSEPQPSAPMESAPPTPNSPGPSDRGASAPAPSPPPSADADMSSAKDPSGGSDAAWDEIKSAHFDVRHQGLSIIKYDEYRRNNPGKNTAELDKFTTEAINWLYWQRMAQLWKKRDDLTAQIKQKEMDLRNQPAGDFHNQLAQEKADLTKKMNETTDALTNEMAFTSDVPPDLESPTMLQKLAQSRNAEKFEDFKRHILKYVRSNHGAVWWDGES